VDDHKPIFSSSIYSVTISELLTLGSFVVEVIVTDNDLPIPQIPVFSITSGNFFNSFMITNAISLPLHGNITVKNNLSYDVMNEYILKIRASSGSFVTSDIDVSITLINELNDTNLSPILLVCLIVAAIIVASVVIAVPLAVTCIIIKCNQVHKQNFFLANAHVEETAMAEVRDVESILFDPRSSNTNEGIDIEESEHIYDQIDVNTQNTPAISNTNENTVIEGTEEYEQMDVNTQNTSAISNTNENTAIEGTEEYVYELTYVNTQNTPAISK
jgi:hypothetical protein